MPLNLLESGKNCLFVMNPCLRTSYFTKTGTLVGRQMSHITFNNNRAKNNVMMTEYLSRFQKTL